MAHRYLPNKNPYRFYRPRIFACTKFAPVFHTVLHIYLWILIVTEPAASPNSVVHVQLRPNPLLIPIAKRKNHQYLRLEKKKSDMERYSCFTIAFTFFLVKVAADPIGIQIGRTFCGLKSAS